jgi:putative GTP pyrophosphokinase
METVLHVLKVNNEEILNTYKSNIRRYKCLEEEVKHIIEGELEVRGIKIHSIASRIKKQHSILDKIERKNYSSLDEIHDIVGTRVVCLFLEDIDLIGQCLKECFNIISEDNKIEESDVSSFGYMSLHFIGKIKDDFRGPRYDGLKDLVFEIQVRTISMDAWANISHYLDYKNERDLPRDLKKDFHALSGLFYVADKHFQLFVKSSEESKAENLEVVQHLLSGDGVQQKDDVINSDALSALLYEKYSEREIYSKITAKSVSSLIEELTAVGITKISELVKILDKTEQAFKLYESENKPWEGIYNPLGVVRMSLALFYEEYREGRYKEDNFHEERYQELIIRD